MTPARILVLALISLCGIGLLGGAEWVGVSGSRTKYITPAAFTVGAQTVSMRLTGTALRQRYFFSVYTIGSYVQSGQTPQSAEALAVADCPKVLHLVMERDLDGKDLAEAFATAIRKNHPA